jgi:hypothetical protein
MELELARREAVVNGFWAQPASLIFELRLPNGSCPPERNFLLQEQVSLQWSLGGVIGV